MSPATPPSRARARFVLAILFVVYVFNFIDRQILSILIGPIQNELGVSDTAMGLLSGFTFAIFYTLAGIPIARLSDRGSRSGVIAVSLALWSLMTAATGFAQSFWQLALARIGVGVGEAGGSPPSHSLLSDYFPPERRATALALYANGIYVGAGLAYLLGGWVVTHFDWRTAYFAIGLAGLPLALLVRATVRELPRGFWEQRARARRRAPPRRRRAFASAVRELFAKPSFGWLVAAACCQSIAGYGILNWGAEFLARVHGLSRLEIGAWMGPIILLGGCAGVSFGGWLADRLGARDPRWFLRLPAVVAVAALPFAALFLLLPTPVAALACFAPYYAISNMYVGPLWSTAQNLARPELRATASALLLFILNLIGLGLGPLAVGAAQRPARARLRRRARSAGRCSASSSPAASPRSSTGRASRHLAADLAPLAGSGAALGGDGAPARRHKSTPGSENSGGLREPHRPALPVRARFAPDQVAERRRRSSSRAAHGTIQGRARQKPQAPAAKTAQCSGAVSSAAAPRTSNPNQTSTSRVSREEEIARHQERDRQRTEYGQRRHPPGPRERLRARARRAALRAGPRREQAPDEGLHPVHLALHRGARAHAREPALQVRVRRRRAARRGSRRC